MDRRVNYEIANQQKWKKGHKTRKLNNHSRKKILSVDEGWHNQYYYGVILWSSNGKKVRMMSDKCLFHLTEVTQEVKISGKEKVYDCFKYLSGFFVFNGISTFMGYLTFKSSL